MSSSSWNELLGGEPALIPVVCEGDLGENADHRPKMGCDVERDGNCCEFSCEAMGIGSAGIFPCCWGWGCAVLLSTVVEGAWEGMVGYVFAGSGRELWLLGGRDGETGEQRGAGGRPGVISG